MRLDLESARDDIGDVLAAECARECGGVARERCREQRDQGACVRDQRVGPRIVSAARLQRCELHDEGHHIERADVAGQQLPHRGDRDRNPRPRDRLLGEVARPQELGDVLPLPDEVDRQATAICGSPRRDRGDRGIEDGLAPAQGARSDRTVARASVAPDAQAFEVVDGVEAWPATRTGDAANLSATNVGVERTNFDPQVLRGGTCVDQTLIVDSTLINHTEDATSGIRR